MEKLTLTLTHQEVEVVYKGLLEMPAKVAIPIMKMIEDEIKKIETDKTKKDTPK